MPNPKKLRRVQVQGLQGIFNYNIAFPDGYDTIIIIAPNGFGKTALLSLIRDCVSLKLRRVTTHVFQSITIEFIDGSRWEYTKVIDDDRVRSDSIDDRELIYGDRDLFYSKTEGRRAYFKYGHPDRGNRIELKRFDTAGIEIAQNLAPDLSDVNPRLLSRMLDRVPFLTAMSSGRVRDVRDGRVFSPADALAEAWPEISEDPKMMEMLSVSLPSIAWPGVSAIECQFIETQRLLYSRERPNEPGEKPIHEEEIVRQAQTLASLLQQNYSDYAATSQSLDRSFPNRLIARARSGQKIDTSHLRESLSNVEKRRAALTEAGILTEQSDAIIDTDDELLPKVVDALQIYVEDSEKKLGTYDAIYPKISVFLDLLNAKLKPKRIIIGREFGAVAWRDRQRLSLQGLSSGEKHEFIMLFKLIFETKPDSLVLIDEPEISLHVVWQLEFMQDLRRIQSANPFQSIIATHSPQIFQGFNHIVVDLAEQI